jgi:UDP-2-acetamido-2-deoxy-ribo-hexuluronate aminotransferase
MTLQKPIAFIDLETQKQIIYSSIMDRILGVLAHGKYIMGPEVNELESRLADFVRVKHAISCSSGTDALLMALMAYEVGPGDAIFTTPFTFIATAEVIQLLGAVPVFVDIDPRTFNIDPDALAASITNFGQNPATLHLKPRGIIPVDLFGQPADYERINALARNHGLFVLEDAAQAFGATRKEVPACALADIAATSFFPAKPLGCYGDGGAVFTNDDGVAEILRSIRVHGQGSNKYDNIRLGINGRLDTIQAAILLEKLEIFPQEVHARQEAAQRYQELLESAVKVPYLHPNCTSVWAQYSVLSDERSALQQKLKAAGIPSAVYYPKPLHLQEAFVHLDFKKGDFPISERCAERIFSLPMHPYLTIPDQRKIAKFLQD